MPRKTPPRAPPAGERLAASMRPRPDAAENAADHDLRDRPDPASMRPRPDAAENPRFVCVVCGRSWGFNEAAARCRGKHGGLDGSDRPARGFNEAAARCRGKRRRVRSPATFPPRFNEAAARCRGKRPRRGDRRRPRRRFNEAAARCRGKRRGGHVGRLPLRPASMRPRPDAAENPVDRRRPPGPALASMRPRPDAAENPRCPVREAAGSSLASMRPRPDAAENLGGRIETPTRGARLQ